MTGDESNIALPASAWDSHSDRSMDRLDMGNYECIAYDRRSHGDQAKYSNNDQNVAMWVPEAASCLNTTAPSNKAVDRWLIDTGCGYDLVSRDQVASVNKLIRQAAKPRTFPDCQWYHNGSQSSKDDDRRIRCSR
ncbi:MAG: hypothetical protein ACKPKO_05320, partial [Candidatus Fonsibacter sp.]